MTFFLRHLFALQCLVPAVIVFCMCMSRYLADPNTTDIIIAGLAGMAGTTGVILWKYEI